MNRIDNRLFDELRQVKITKDYLIHPDGAVLIEVGNTKVICTAIVEERVPPFLKGTGKGWVTAEYSMLPGSTKTRKARDINRLKMDGRTQEIQRLIGRSLRSVVDLNGFGERTLAIDCDVIQADGGTRTASITGAFVAMAQAFNSMRNKKLIEKLPIKSFVSAVSVGIVKQEILLDLCYEEDSNAIVDMNIVMTDKNEFIEVQGTGEESPFKYNELIELIKLGTKGCQELYEIQRKAIGEELSEVLQNEKKNSFI
jgi:ribonuclease PH